MQSEITKKLTVDLDKRKSALIEGLVGGVYGEKYRKRIEDVVNSIFFCVFSDDIDVILDTLNSPIMENILENKQKSIEIFEHINDEEVRKMNILTLKRNDDIKNSSKKIFEFCKKNGLDRFIRTTKDLEVLISKDSETHLFLFRELSKIYGMKHCFQEKNGYFVFDDDKLKQTPLYKYIESDGILDRVEKYEKAVYKILRNGNILGNANMGFFNKNEILVTPDNKFMLDADGLDSVQGMSACAWVAIGKNTDDQHNVVFLPFIPQAFYDITLLHELIHLLEYQIIEINREEEYYVSRSGFDTITQSFRVTMDLEELENEDKTDEYCAALNESIVEWLAIKAGKFMAQNGMECCISSKNDSSYIPAVECLNDAFELMFDDLVKYRMTHNFDGFVHFFGEKQFNYLARTAYEAMDIEIQRDLELLKKSTNLNLLSVQDVKDNLEYIDDSNVDLVRVLNRVENIKLHYEVLKDKQSRTQNVNEQADEKL